MCMFLRVFGALPRSMLESATKADSHIFYLASCTTNQHKIGMDTTLCQAISKDGCL
jgi:hypothetical protein